MKRKVQYTWDGNELTVTAYGQTVSVNLDEIPANSQAFVMRYGLKQILGDGLAGRNDADRLVARAEALKKGYVDMRPRTDRTLEKLKAKLAADPGLRDKLLALLSE